MKNEYFLPKIMELHIDDYDLYKCPFDIIFSKKLNLIFGTNGLGKTTFLNILQYSIIGPYTGKITFRNWKDQQKLRRPMLGKKYFRSRMNNVKESAMVKVVFLLGNDQYEVWHNLYEFRIDKLMVNGKEILGEIYSYENYEKKYFGKNDEDLSCYLINIYHSNIIKSSAFPDINSFILMITEVMFFSEVRDFVFWDQNMCKSILSKFLPQNKYFEYDEVQKLVKKFDSQARLTSYKMSMIKDFLGEDFLEEVVEETKYTLKDLQVINEEIENVQLRIERHEKELSQNDREKTQNRVGYEQISKKLLEIEKQWYENIFPDTYQDMYNRYAPFILSGKRPFCGEEHLDVKLHIEDCFYCKKPIRIKKKVDLSDLEIERRNLENERKRLQNNLELLKKEASIVRSNLRGEEKELQQLIIGQQKIKKELDIVENDNVAKYRRLELLKKQYIADLEDAKKKERELALEIDEIINEVFAEYKKAFKKYAYSFLGNDKTIDFELVGKAEDSFFRFYLNGTERETETALSESQRIFVDMAYRLATLEFFHKDSYFISETPDSTLDYLFEENAVNTFSYFIDSGNTVFMSANARNSRLINELAKKYQGDFELINLLEKSNLAGERFKELRKLELYDFLEVEK